jgi:alkylation response protein AidB-like acyl-CoA dehydrogenase
VTDTIEASTETGGDIVEEFRTWLDDNWDPDQTVADWWDRLGRAGWSAPTWPVEWYGKGVSRDEANRLSQALSEHGALGPPGGLGLLLAGPTIVTHGDDEQRARFLVDIVTGQKAWCQLFSEPGAGSDLAGLQTKAIQDGDEWIVDGQKVWTSGGQYADLGMLLARTDPDVPKHQGISYFGLDMDQPGIDVRPLKEMTGRALFNEVFISEARVADADLLGGRNNGWAVANTTLMHERTGLGAGGGSAAASAALPGTKADHLDRRAGDFVRERRARGGGMFGRSSTFLLDVARGTGAIEQASVRQDLMRLHTMNEIARFTNLRLKAAKEQGQSLPSAANTAKLSMSRITRLSRDLGLQILGPAGTLMGTDAPHGGMLQEMALFAPAVSIYGGSDEIQKNIIGERVLGLPGEPRTDKDRPFREVKVGTQAG